MSALPNCPKCNSEYTYEDGSMLVCPMCAYEWNPAADAEAAEANVICLLYTSDAADER